MTRLVWFVTAALLCGGCVFEEFKTPIPPIDAGNSVTVDMGSTDDVGADSGTDMAAPPTFDVVTTGTFGSPSWPGARTGFGPIPEGFTAIELTEGGSIRSHSVNYDGSTSVTITEDVTDQDVILMAGAPVFDAVSRGDNFIATFSTSGSAIAVFYCRFAFSMCSFIEDTAFDRGTDLALGARTNAAVTDVTFYLTNDDGQGVVVGNYRAPPNANVLATKTGSTDSTDAFELRVNSQNIAQLAWYNDSQARYEMGRWRDQDFVDGPRPCGGAGASEPRIVPLAATGTMVLLRDGELVVTDCDGSETVAGVTTSVRAFDVQRTPSGDFLLAWVTDEDDVWAARVEAGGEINYETRLAESRSTVAGIRVAANVDRLAVLTWGAALQTWILSD